MAKKGNRKGRVPVDVDNQNDDVLEFEKMKYFLMTAMSEMGVTGEEYASFLNSDKVLARQGKSPESIYDEQLRFDSDICDTVRPQEANAIDDADKKSLRLKVQMKDVKKPPMWREIIIPADFDFLQLHYAIQAVTGLENSHLWQFQHQAYNSDLQIGMPSEYNDGFGLDEFTHDADTTPVSAFLAKKGDKLEYVYDFGDDWVFVISVLEVMTRNGDVAECRKWKCDFQPIEDCGGVWSYLQLRDAFSAPDKLTAKMKKQLADNFGFEDFQTLQAWIDDSMFDIVYVNERLADIPVRTS